jgi:lysophospholipase L1-like esterase
MYWYNEEVQLLEQKKYDKKSEKFRVVFYGSSSLRLWTSLEQDFPDYEVINSAFGGSTFSACNWFFERLITPLKPDCLIIYAGDNDLGDGRHPEEVFINFKYMMSQIEQHFGIIPVAFIAIKHSFARQYLHNSIAYCNTIIGNEIAQNHPNCSFIDINKHMSNNGLMNMNFFEQDGLHLSKSGYCVWKNALSEEFFAKTIQNKI